MLETKTKVKDSILTLLSKPYKLLLHNDDFNSFDYVIECLIKVCEHDIEQATQCAYMVHNNGKCDIKYGSLEEISKMNDKLKLLGLLSTIEVN